MIKKSVTLTEKNIADLKKEADKVGIKSSEMLRRILEDRYKDSVDK